LGAENYGEGDVKTCSNKRKKAKSGINISFKKHLISLSSRPLFASLPLLEYNAQVCPY